ncbi:MAG: hypothetical protein P3W94_004470, partial [Paracoccus sp. (in: a-proteobacteria)]|nr:hypothetical protein [Paracoccus sp. (in: a-proteobacteria)]
GADDSVVRGWLTRALTASRGPQWVCDKCHNVMHAWAPVCDSCGGFDTLTWREPDAARSGPVTSSTGAEMLPLLIGAPRADAPADSDPDRNDPVQAHPSGTPAGEPAPRPSPTAKVAPGMVPRESDYDDYEPVRTVTDPTPPSPERASSRPAETQSVPVPDLAGKAEDEPARDADSLVIPETPPTAPQPDTETSRSAAATPEGARMSGPAAKSTPEPDDEPQMVRPDVEPPESADWTEGKMPR